MRPTGILPVALPAAGVQLRWAPRPKVYVPTRARRGSKIQRQFFRVFDAFLHFDEESDCFFPIDGAMIVAERQIHHRADFYFPVHGNGPRYDFVHAENPALRRIQDRRREERSVHATVRDREITTLQIFNLQFSFARCRGVIGNVALQIGKTFLVRIAHHRHDKPTFRPDGRPQCGH